MKYSSLFFILILIAFKSFPQNSILSEGQWFKLGIIESGVYRVDRSFFSSNNINPDNIDPNKIQIFGSGYNGYLPQLNSESNYFEPKEIEIQFFGDEDSNFDDGEYIYFYLQSSDKIYYDSLNNEVTSLKNVYTDTSFYFININNNPSKKISNYSEVTNYNQEKNNAYYYFHFENDLYSIIQSGREWYGEIFSPGQSKKIPLFEFIDNSNLSINLGLVSRSTVESDFSVLINNQELTSIDVEKIRDNIYGDKSIKINRRLNNKFSSMEDNILELIYHGESSAISYLDYIKINANIKLNYSNSQKLFFTKPQNDNIFSKYIINSNIAPLVWNISDPYNIKNYSIKPSQNNFYFIKDDKTFSNNIIFSLTDLKYPLSLNEVRNSNIINHSNPELVIITTELFYEDAIRIKNLRESKDNLSVMVVIVDDIYNQFSSGNQDITSIRNFIKYVYNSSSQNLKYVLLFGDCSYDYKDRIPNNTNIVPIYQSFNSSNNIYSYSSDDYLGFLESDEGLWTENSSGDHDLEVGIGRIPSKNLTESKSYVDKLYRYSENKELIGDWKKSIYLVADDGDNNVHQNDAENHFNLLDNESGEYNIKKIYLDSYRQEIDDGIVTSLDAKNSLNEAIDRGSLILNYIGHGNEFLWTEEKILDENSIYNWKNRTKLPLFLTATCEFGKFDDPLITSGGEMLLNKDDGGAIALLTTTRPVFSQTNFRLNNQFYKNVFNKVNGEYLRLGDIFRITKNKSLSGPINRNFSLLGDPSLKLSYPSYSIKTNSIDTLKATGKIIISGEIVDDHSNKIHDFNGNLYVTVYDKISSKITLGNESDPFPYKEWDDIIFKGLSSVSNGSFQIEFVTPRNIDYNFGDGKITLYAVDTIDFYEASSFSNFIIGGTSDEYLDDDSPPEIDIFIDSYDFKSGSRVSQNPLLIVELYDKNGLNITNKNSFQTMTAIIDDSIAVELNEYFSTKKDDYTRGVIRFPLENLKGGKHKIKIKVADNYNNLSSKSVVFIIGNENLLKISNLMNYPNPFAYETTFSFDNDEFEQPLNVILEIYDLRGNLVYEFNKIYEFSPKKVDDIVWNGKDLNNYSLPQGMYIYKLHVYNLLDDSKIILHNKLLKKL